MVFVTAPIHGAADHQVLILLLQIGCYWLWPWGSADSQHALGMPPVVGELIAGVALGLSLLGNLAPAVPTGCCPGTLSRCICSAQSRSWVVSFSW